MKDTKSDIVFYLSFFVVFSLGIFLRLYHIGYRSLWYDEAWHYLYIDKQSIGAMFESIKHYTALPGYSLLSYYVIKIFGNSEIIIRAVSSVFGILSLFLLFLCVRQYIGRWPSLFAAYLFAVNSTQVYFSREFKQYSAGVFFSVLLIYFLSLFEKKRRIKYVVLFYLSAALGMFFDYGAVITFTALNLYLFIRFLIDKDIRSRIIVPVACSLIVGLTGLVFYFVFIRVQSANMYGMLAEYWADYMPQVKSAGALAVWVFTAVKGYIKYFTIWFPVCIPLLFILTGIERMIRRKIPFAVLWIMITGTGVLFALLRLYPFGGTRVSLYSTPLVYVCMGCGIYVVAEFLASKKAYASAIALAGIFLYYPGMESIDTYVMHYKKIDHEAVKQVLLKVKGELRPQDTIYVYDGAYPAFTYYKDRLGINSLAVKGTKRTGDISKFKRDVTWLIKSRKENIWFIFSHIYMEDNKREMFSFLERNAIHLCAEANGAYIFLYSSG